MDSDPSTIDRNSYILTTLQTLSQSEIQAKETQAQVFTPGYEAFLSTLPERALNRTTMLANRLKSLYLTTMGEAKRMVKPSDDLEIVFRQASNELTYELFLKEEERSALQRASEEEAKRQIDRNKTSGGMSLAIQVPPKRILSSMLWEIRER
jgi:hypothetical protein